MKTLPSRKRQRILFGTATLLLLAFAYAFWTRGAVWLASAHLERSPSKVAGLVLQNYTATVQAKPIAGLSHNTSGLTYSSATDTLFTVINRPPALAELSTDGQLLRHMPLPGLSDPEGITHLAGDAFLVVDEADQRLHHMRLAPGATEPQLTPAASLALGHDAWHNLGLEGLSWDAHRSELLLTNEKWPQRVHVVDGLLSPDAPPHMQQWQPVNWLGFPGRDLASVASVEDSGNLLLLSEASALVAEYTRNGRLVGLMPLWAGRHGLVQTVPQPEGITVGSDGAIYVVSEPNLFYRFERHSGNAGL